MGNTRLTKEREKEIKLTWENIDPENVRCYGIDELFNEIEMLRKELTQKPNITMTQVSSPIAQEGDLYKIKYIHLHKQVMGLRDFALLGGHLDVMLDKILELEKKINK